MGDRELTQSEEEALLGSEHGESPQKRSKKQKNASKKSVETAAKNFAASLYAANTSTKHTKTIIKPSILADATVKVDATVKNAGNSSKKISGAGSTSTEIANQTGTYIANTGAGKSSTVNAITTTPKVVKSNAETGAVLSSTAQANVTQLQNTATNPQLHNSKMVRSESVAGPSGTQKSQPNRADAKKSAATTNDTEGFVTVKKTKRGGRKYQESRMRRESRAAQQDKMRYSANPRMQSA